MKTPWHIWVVGILALLWNAGGAADYVMTQYDIPEYTSNMPEEMKALLETYPVWMDAVWALAVWLPVLGALLLLGRRKAAAWVFGVGLIFVLIAGAYNYLISDPALHEVAGIWVLGFWAAVVVIAVFLWLYARRMARAGILE